MLKSGLLKKTQRFDDITVIAETIAVDSAGTLKDIAFQLKNEIPDLFLVLGSEISGKAHLAVMVSENLVNVKSLNASTIIREISRHIQGGGGGQPFFATAGGKNPAGINDAVKSAVEFVKPAN
jgi:alanyl-tRNA synthetase